MLESNNSLPNKNTATDRDQAMVMILTDLLKEQKRRRLTDVVLRLTFLAAFFFTTIIVVIVLSVGIASINDDEVSSILGSTESHVALVEFNGVLEASADNHSRTLTSLKKAFKASNARGVILKINSPGGSPVVADELYQEIKTLRAKYPQKKLIVVTGDVCASGGYYVAVAADKIFVNHSSIVGSIGVIHMSMGVSSLLDKIGVEPRIITAGDRKAMLNPFVPITAEGEAHLKTLLTNIHQRFINVVKEGRGDKLKDNNVFNGLFWTGEEAVRLGLADGISTVAKVAKDEIGETNVVNYSSKPFNLERFLSTSISKLLSQVMLETLMTR